MAKILIVGMGIGDLYRRVLIHHNTFTVDTEKPASYRSVDDVKDTDFQVGIICTPNFTHREIAEKLASKCKIVVVEKPGLKTEMAWRELEKTYPNTRFMMTKNNMYRDNIDQIISLVDGANQIDINWANRDRVPNPGTWFTNKELAFGGVSRDLMPHLLSLYIAMFSKHYKELVIWRRESKQNHQLGKLISTDYGKMDPNGVYDVDDYARLETQILYKTVNLYADWKTDQDNDIAIHFHMNTEKLKGEIIIPLGLCPESAYRTMIETAISNVDNDAYWQLQYEHDCFIHRIMEKLSEG